MMAVYRIEIFDLDGNQDGMDIGYSVTGGGLPLTCAGSLVCQLAETLSRIACNVDLPAPRCALPGPLPLGEGDRQPRCNLNRPWEVERGGLFTGEDENNGDA